MKRNFYTEMLLQKKEIQCQTCENGCPAVTKCFDCDQYMCSLCFKTHQKLKVSRSHRSCDIGNEIQGTQTQTTYCSKHQEEQLRFFCCPCKLTYVETVSSRSTKDTELRIFQLQPKEQKSH
jgi:tripartite motif-containing protein 56